ncbi:uncharacterized protein PHACADRAFT_261854 [Phanerochaete carnosa HHB-10118-sp]|uniref:Uncharacterized protein n=1 Tax=Phanerochaete carnosa (strain HHB-10118-sp) TaxID=650164 RepID=K5VYC4_PHACS|nr:uncharacterized protein PHACADRAFT_261854 [Phanerochaete carnosa HHB-10118-sp]EKM51609.1 hypothetical protein PHACADRAFT_261854 [Phanerochaete carnosa HHB-10118-sp]
MSDDSVFALLPSIVVRLTHTKHAGLCSAIQSHLRSSIAKLHHFQEVQAPHLIVSECWVAFGRFLLHLFVPDTPIDPAGLKRCSDEYWTRERAIIESQLDLHKAFARRTHGHESSGTIHYLESLLSDMQPVENDPRSSQSRADLGRLHMFWSEVDQFISQVLSAQKISSYLAIAASGDPAASMREQVLQKSLATFCQRLRAVYPDFADVNAPLQHALLAMRLGLRISIAAHHSNPAVRNPNVPLHSALLAFPSVQSAELLRAHSSTMPASNSSFTVVLTRLCAISYEVQLSGDVENYLMGIERIYEQALGLWLVDQSRAEEAERQAQSLYRRKDDGSLNEAEEEEEDFLSIFPEFEDILDSDGAETQQKTLKRKTLVDSSTTAALFAIHQELFLAAGSRLTAAATRFLNERRSLVVTLVESEMATWADTVDADSLPFQARFLHDRLSALSHIPRLSGGPYDFYFDENIPEAKKAVQTMRALMQRLEAVIREWPEQMVLQHLKNRCEVIMNFSLHSPLAKILSALEHLLANIDDWEMYTNRDNSLKAHQQAIIAVVVDWRRLELSSWQGLLDSQARAFEAGISDWWFRLYDTSIRGVLKLAEDGADDTGRSDAITEFLDKLVPLLDEFMVSSPLGQFVSRLRLVDSMQIYADKLANYLGDARGSALQRVHKVLSNTAKYYDQFEVKVTESLSKQRKVLEKDIRDFIKLASWKDVNIHALKQSAQKTHRQLYKVIRKFRELLRQPVLPLLESATSRTAVASSGENFGPSATLQATYPLPGPIFPVVSDASQPAHLQKIDRTFRNFDTLVCNRLISFVQAHDAHTAGDLAEDIISVSKSLESVTIPTNLDTARRTKLAKNLLNRKRKAWSDLLKELKRAGFSANVKPEILQQNHSKRHLREQPVLASSAREYGAVAKSEDYLHRVSGLLPQLRQALSDHHPDLSTRELQRALMHIEHNFSICLRTRSS